MDKWMERQKRLTWKDVLLKRGRNECLIAKDNIVMDGKTERPTLTDNQFF